MPKKLFEALRSEDEEKFETLLKVYKNVNQLRFGDYYNTLLHTAVECNLLNSVSLLLKQGAIITAENTQGKTPLHIACEQIPPNLDIIQLLLDNDAPLYHTDYANCEPIDCISNQVTDETYQKITKLFEKTQEQRNLRDALKPSNIGRALATDKLNVNDQSDNLKQSIIFAMLDFSDQYTGLSWYFFGTSLSSRLTTGLAVLNCLDTKSPINISPVQAIILTCETSHWNDTSFATGLFRRILNWSHPELSHDKITGDLAGLIFSAFKRRVDAIDESAKSAFDEYRNSLSWKEVENTLQTHRSIRDTIDNKQLAKPQTPETHFLNSSSNQKQPALGIDL